jgi:hypothetical protein
MGKYWLGLNPKSHGKSLKPFRREILDKILLVKYTIVARSWWLMPVILATQEAEIRRIEVRNQPRQIVPKTLSRKTLHKKGLVERLKL